VTANLAGETARIDARLAAGRATTLTLTGRAPLGPSGPIDLRADGSLDLALLDPILTAAGRQARGQVTLDVGVAGTVASPRLTGTAQLARGEVQDYAEGLRINDISALVQLEGDSVRIARFTGRAGPGSISVSGTVGALAPGVPIDLRLQATDARPLSSDRLTVSLNADLTLTGPLTGQPLLAGRIDIPRAEIRIPEHLPTGVATLKVRRPGQKPPPPPSPGPDIALNLAIEAPRAVFVRGRGLDAELGGTVQLEGTVAALQPTGKLEMRRGQLSFGGGTLTFTRGEIGFDGGSLTDPSLDFLASTTNGSVTANLNVGGTASNPKFTFSSTPELPQDEVLAELLFGRSASSLSPFELAQMAAALAKLTGAVSSGGDPLNSIRQGLGLDRLSVGSGPGGNATLEAGRYVAPGVYVGARQGVATSDTQATVQIDLTKGLKLEGTVGTSSSSATGSSGAGGSSIGVLYQFEY
jgi:translocation and assembly module TamB